MLDKSKRFKKTLGGFDKPKINQFDFPEATPGILSEIRNKIKKRQRRVNVIMWAIFFLFIAIIFVWVL